MHNPAAPTPSPNDINIENMTWSLLRVWSQFGPYLHSSSLPPLRHWLTGCVIPSLAHHVPNCQLKLTCTDPTYGAWNILQGHCVTPRHVVVAYFEAYNT